MTLRETLDNMLREAQLTKLPARRNLARGLRVAIRLEGKLIDLQLARGDIYPSLSEWKTVLQQWPVPVSVVKPPKALVKGNEYFLKGQVRAQEKLV